MTNIRTQLNSIALLAIYGCTFALPGLAQTKLDPSCLVNVGGGWTFVKGKDGGSLQAGPNFQGGVKFKIGDSGMFYLGGNFLFDRSEVSQDALQQARALNSTNIGLLQATAGRAKFFSATFEPTFRFNGTSPISPYAFAGFGWFRRTLAFTGSANQGALLQPNNPVVFGNGGDSGSYTGGGGLDIKLASKGRRLMGYVEVRFIRGLGINSATTLVPVSGGIRW